MKTKINLSDKTKNIVNKLIFMLLILWMIVIFCFSHQPVNESIRLSGSISKPIAEKLESIIKIDVDEENFDYMIRKFSHFMEYMILGILMYLASVKSNIPKNNKLLCCILLCALYAVTDEIHQAFVPGRGPKVFDVIIDTIGSIAGILMIKLKMK